MVEFQTKISEIKYLTLKTVELTVDLVNPDEIKFEAGQFMQFLLGKAPRSYSIVSIPNHNRQLKFCIELLDKGLVSQFLKQAKVGSFLPMQGPLGNFLFDRPEKNAFFVATGVGIAPFASIIPNILSTGYSGKAQLLFGVKHEEDVFYFDKFRHMANLYQNFKFVPILSQPQSHWPGESGRVTTYLEVAYEYFKDYIFYICGNTEMVKESRELLLKRGHDPKNIRLEIFI